MVKINNIGSYVRLMLAGGLGSLAISSALVKDFEGVEYKPYYDVAGHLTVCWGHTGKDIDVNKIYTKEECEALLDADLLAVKKSVDPLIKITINDATRAALYSFVYNVGIGNFSKSTLLKKLNSSDITGACDQLKRWVYAGGKKWKGLITRREIEGMICKLDLKQK